MLKLQDFQYVLPQEFIAQTPAEPRDSSRLMVVDRIKKELTHKIFSDLPNFLRRGDVLVLNNSKTIPGRTVGLRPAGKPMEVLFLNPLRVEKNKNRNASDSTTEEWEVLSKPGLKVGQEVQIQNSPLHIHVLEDLGYTRRVRVTGARQSVLHELESCGTLPLPPYIQQSPQDQNRYQTLYAKTAGSAATPTAGLHFTPRVLDYLRELGVIIVELTLHVGLGTFLPVKVDDLESHRMHSEWYEMSPHTASVINQAKTENRRVIAVGTTSIRTLESCINPEQPNRVLAGSGDTDIFLYPPYRFRIADGLITNFHLPASTLLMLISAFCSQHEPFTTFADSLAGKAYQEAIQERYRFFSFGDAMLIL